MTSISYRTHFIKILFESLVWDRFIVAVNQTQQWDQLQYRLTFQRKGFLNYHAHQSMDMWAKIQKTFTGLMCGLRGKRNDWNIYWNRRNNDNQGMRRIQTSTCPRPKNFLYCFHFFAVFQLRFDYLGKIYCWFITKHSKNPWNCCYSAAGTKNGLLHIPVVLGLRGGSLQLMTHCFVLLLEA